MSIDDRNKIMNDDAEIDAMSLDLPAKMFFTGGKAEETTIVMHRRFIGPVFRPNAKFTEVDGMALFEGDIVLGSADEARNLDYDKGIGIVGEEFRWPGGIVPYEAEEAVLARVQAAIAHWERYTPIHFVERSDRHKDYISFKALGGCRSKVGRHGGMQVISLGKNCSVGSAIHEIGHALGLWHEQGRSDRDAFITVVMENIDPDYLHNFDKHVLDGEDLGAYDFGSIMHYPPKAFSVNGQDTIRTKNGESIGQRNGLSRGDIESIKLMYPDLDWP
jgi:hypothetical protein